jgi:ferredoxin-NADP reductase
VTDPPPEPPDSGQLPVLPSPAELPALPTLGPVSRQAPPGGARRPWQWASVAWARMETRQARTLRLELQPGSPPHVPGQHYVVRAARDDGSWAQRSYSVASAPDRKTAPGGLRMIELTVELLVDGELSPFLHTLAVGDEIEVRGPFGGWFIWRGEGAALLVGGGSGVVPLMSIARYWRACGRLEPLRMLYSVRSPDDVYYRDGLGEETTLLYTRRTPDGASRRPGRVGTDDLRPLLMPGATCYVCGSAGFAEHASQLLVELGIPATDVRVERFGPS